LSSSLRAGHRCSSPPSFIPPCRSPLVAVPEPQLKQVAVAARVADELVSPPSCLGKDRRHAMMYLAESRLPDTHSPVRRTADVEPCQAKSSSTLQRCRCLPLTRAPVRPSPHFSLASLLSSRHLAIGRATRERCRCWPRRWAVVGRVAESCTLCATRMR
jgi:hypothetical protein